MSRVRALGILLVIAVVLAAAGCSSGNDDSSTTSRPALQFGDGPTKSTRLGVCAAFPIKDMKKILGGGGTFRVLPPTAIGKKGDAVTGETCSWQRGAQAKDFASLQIEARNYGTDTATLISNMDELQQKTVGATPQPGLGDAAFSSEGTASTLLQIRKAGYFLTFASRSEGKLHPVPLSTLKFLAAAGLAKLK
jgi:hypothetical protein